MSEQIDTETKSYSRLMDEVLNHVIYHAEDFRTQRLSGAMPKESSYLVTGDNQNFINLLPLKDNRYLALFYDIADIPDKPMNDKLLVKHSDAWILYYDSQHARWSSEAWNKQIGNKKFI
ncbi:unnamed protein product, partial [marine sediment metagenome]